MKYCRLIIQLVAILHIVGGVLLSFVSVVPAVAEVFVAHVFPASDLSMAEKSKILYLMTVFGPTAASWGILLWALCRSYFQHPDKLQWYGLCVAVVVWYLGDTILTMRVGAIVAVYLNTIIAVALLVPIWLARPLAFADKKISHSV